MHEFERVTSNEINWLMAVLLWFFKDMMVNKQVLKCLEVTCCSPYYDDLIMNDHEDLGLQATQWQ